MIFRCIVEDWLDGCEVRRRHGGCQAGSASTARAAAAQRAWNASGLSGAAVISRCIVEDWLDGCEVRRRHGGCQAGSASTARAAAAQRAWNASGLSGAAVISRCIVEDWLDGCEVRRRHGGCQAGSASTATRNHAVSPLSALGRVRSSGRTPSAPTLEVYGSRLRAQAAARSSSPSLSGPSTSAT